MSIYAKMILDSVSPNGDRLSTLEINFNRFILAEVNTHRKFSRNSRSSRAVPISKTIKEVLDDPAMPVWWGKQQPGMQANEELDEESKQKAIQIWLKMRDACVEGVRQLDELGLHKQIANRPLETWMWHRIIVSSTEWENFFHQRLHKDTQPEFRVAAEAMLEALDNSTPTLVDYDEWHTPYIKPEEYEILRLEDRKMISAARSARVSYLTHDNTRDLEKDLELFQKLIGGEVIHHSPTEHVATPARSFETVRGNFDGWYQLRHFNDDLMELQKYLLDPDQIVV
jgi:hypothetical protein